MAYPYLDIARAIGKGHWVLHWRLNEASGTTAADSSGNGYDGTATSVTWGQTGMGDGAGAAGFTNSSVRIVSTGTDLVSDFNEAAGTLSVWFRASGVGVWSDSTYRALVDLYVTGGNSITLAKSSTDNTLTASYVAGGTTVTVSGTVSPDDDWHCLVAAWDVVSDTFTVLFDGAPLGTPGTGLGTWVADEFYFAAGTNAGLTYDWSGDLAHVTLWNDVLPDDELGALSLTDLIAPITDRTLADVLARNSKAFFTVDDWERINANTIITAMYINALHSRTVGHTELTMPDVGNVVDREQVYLLGRNIYFIGGGSVPDYDQNNLEYDFDEGGAGFAPDYQIINLWESQLVQLINDPGP